MQTLITADALNNSLVSALSRSEQQRLESYFETVTLEQGQILDHGKTDDAMSDYAYFPLDSVISLLSTAGDAGAMELAMVGREGFTGIRPVLGLQTDRHRAVVKVAGKALRISAKMLREELPRSPLLSFMLMRYLHALSAQIAQAAFCYHRHQAPQRLQTWMAMMFNRLSSNELHLKQEEIAETLGYRRQTVCYATTALQKQQIIRYSRGRIHLLDRERLRQSTCECYTVMESNYEEIISSFSALPKFATAEGRTETIIERGREYADQLSVMIDSIRLICSQTDELHKRQAEILSRYQRQPESSQ